jgi:phosphatidylglycerol:prolipoprotein diacylglycerol transferase
VTVDALGIHLGPFYVHFYALILMTGLAVGTWLTAHRAPAHGLDPQHVWDGLIWVVIPGLIGARLYHVLTPTPGSGLTTEYYLQNPLQILAIWNGGLGIYGAIAGGIIGILFYGIRHKQPILRWMDLIVPGLALAQAIGRWGNFVNHELYGAPTTLPWAIYIPPENRLPGYQQFSTYHPLFLYESLWNLGACLFMLYLERRLRDWLRPGDMVLIDLILYPFIRFLLDFVRLDSYGFGFLTAAQLISLIACVTGGTLLFIRHRRPVVKQQPAKTE